MFWESPSRFPKNDPRTFFKPPNYDPARAWPPSSRAESTICEKMTNNENVRKSSGHFARRRDVIQQHIWFWIRAKVSKYCTCRSWNCYKCVCRSIYLQNRLRYRRDRAPTSLLYPQRSAQIGFDTAENELWQDCCIRRDPHKLASIRPRTSSVNFAGGRALRAPPARGPAAPPRRPGPLGAKFPAKKKQIAAFSSISRPPM